MPLRFLALISALALLVGAFAGWFARAAAEELNAAETAGSGFVRRPTRSGPASGTGRDGRSPDELTPGPVFDIGGASAAGAMVQRANEERWWNATVMLAAAERTAAQIAAGSAGVAQRAGQSTGHQPGDSVTSPTPASPSGSGDCYGGPVSDDIVNRESGGDPNARNGIYSGCYQIGEPWWNGRCSHLDRSVAGQKACAQIIMDTQGPSAWAG